MYYILPIEEIKLVGKKEIVQSKENLRYSLDKKYFVVKLRKDIKEPKYLTNYKSYSHSEIKKELIGKNWYKEEE